jgi:hypothetical protein
VGPSGGANKSKNQAECGEFDLSEGQSCATLPIKCIKQA